MTVLSGVTVYGVLNSVPLDTYGWRVIEGGYDELLNCPALRGSDLVMPGVPGRRPYPRLIDASIVSIPMVIGGATDQDGTPYSDPLVGLLTNRDYLRDNTGFAAGGDGTVTFTFNRGTLPDWSGPVTNLGFNGFTKIGRYDAMVRLDLSIPDGELAEVGS